MISLSDERYTTAAWAGIALLVVALGYVAMMANWFGAVLVAAFVAASIAFVLAAPLPSLFSLLFVVAAIVNAIGWIWNLYGEIVGYDEVAHILTSFAVTLALGFLIYRRVRAPFREHRLHFVLVIASFGITLGAFWEIFEWALLRPLPNPVVDIIMDSLGAVGAGVAAALALGLEQPDAGAHHGAGWRSCAATLPCRRRRPKDRMP